MAESSAARLSTASPEIGSLAFHDLTADLQQALIKQVTSKEIQAVVHDLPFNESLGPEGFTREFYKAVWGIVGSDLIAVVFSKGVL